MEEQIRLIESGKVEQVLALINSNQITGASIYQNYNNRTPLHYACLHPANGPIVDSLIAIGADVNAQDEGQLTPLHFAAMKGNIEFMKKLIQAGADIKMKDIGGADVFFTLKHDGHSSLIEPLKRFITDFQSGAIARTTTHLVQGSTNLDEAAVRSGNRFTIDTREAKEKPVDSKTTSSLSSNGKLFKGIIARPKKSNKKEKRSPAEERKQLLTKGPEISLSQPSKKMYQKKAYENDRVIVCIWTSAGNLNHPGDSVGHVSIQTRNLYMSLWPKQANHPNEQSAIEAEGPSLFKGISHELLPSYEIDVQYEKREPEVVYCFYSLNVHDIETEFEQIRQSLGGWSLLALAENAESCASLAWRLLCAGGIEKLAPKTTQAVVLSKGSSEGSFLSSKHSYVGSYHTAFSRIDDGKTASKQSIATSFYSSEMAVSMMIRSPDALVEILRNAKLKELEQHSLTKKITLEGETSVEASHNKCPMM